MTDQVPAIDAPKGPYGTDGRTAVAFECRRMRVWRKYVQQRHPDMCSTTASISVATSATTKGVHGNPYKQGQMARATTMPETMIHKLTPRYVRIEEKNKRIYINY